MNPGMRSAFVTAAVVASLLAASFFGYPGLSQSETPQETVKRVLRTERRDWSKAPEAEHAEDLKGLGAEAIPLLAALLTDEDLGDTAAATMLLMDEGKAAPLIFASMPQSDRNVQYHTFTRFIRRVRTHEPFAFSTEMRLAAIRCLEADTNADAAEQALLALGLTGSQEDFPLLERYYRNSHPTAVWAKKLRNASEASLARLGREDHLANIEAELRAPVPSVLTLEAAAELSASIQKAAFSDSQRFVPLLCQHLHDPGVREYDVGVAPASDAAQALSQILDKASPDQGASVEHWKERCTTLIGP